MYALEGGDGTLGPSVPAETLVVYTYSKSDPEYERNLEFFVAHGMWEGDGCQYLIIVQQVLPRQAGALVLHLSCRSRLVAC